MTLFERIESEIEKRGMTRSDLSRLSGIGESTLRAWRTTEPKARMLYAVAKALNLTMEYLLTGQKKESAPQSPLLSLPENVAPEDLKDLRSIAETYPRLASSQKQMIMACLKAASETPV